MGTRLNCIDVDAIQMSTHNICFYKEIQKKTSHKHHLMSLSLIFSFFFIHSFFFSFLFYLFIYLFIYFLFIYFFFFCYFLSVP